MAGSEHAPDILAEMPLWVQVAANLGMFIVAVIAAAFGFATKRIGSFLPEQHFAEGGQFHTIGGDIREGIAALTSVAESMKALLVIQLERQRQDEVEREVQRRLKEQGADKRA